MANKGQVFHGSSSGFQLYDERARAGSTRQFFASGSGRPGEAAPSSGQLKVQVTRIQLEDVIVVVEEIERGV
jgi:hypothetical protein